MLRNKKNLSWVLVLSVLILIVAPLAWAGTGSISGTVIAANGGPSVGATVQIFDTLRGFRLVGTVITDNAGQFTASGIGGGEFVLKARKDGRSSTELGSAIVDKGPSENAVVTIRMKRIIVPL